MQQKLPLPIVGRMICHNNNLKLTVSLAAIRKNYAAICDFTKRKVAAVLKANAYGIGLEPVARTVYEEGCITFFVATVFEGVQLRKILGQKSEILILNSFHKKDLAAFKKHALSPVINTLQQFDLWAENFGKEQVFAVHFDTGMGRLGVFENEIELLQEKMKRSGYVPNYVLSHLACADQPDHPLNEKQRKLFERISDLFPESIHSLAASEALNLPETYYFDMLRIGKALYGGIQSIEGSVTAQLTFAFKTQARILQIKTLKAGETTGYGGTYQAKKDRKIAVIGMGFADGLPRSCSNTGSVYIGTYRAPIIGRVSMDLTVIDVSDIPSELLSEETWVDVIRDRTSFVQQAVDSSSGIYELITRLGARYERVYQK